MKGSSPLLTVSGFMGKVVKGSSPLLTVSGFMGKVGG